MTISLGNALKSVKEDEKWIQKSIIGGLMFIGYWLGLYFMQNSAVTVHKLIGLAVYSIFAVFIFGFHVSTGNKMMNSDSNSMAEWTDKNLIVNGIKFLCCYFVYGIVFAVLCTLVSIAILLLIALVLGLIYYLVYLLLHPEVKLSAAILTFIGTVFYLVLALYFLQFLNAAYTCYYKNIKFRDLMALKKQFRIIKENQHASWTLIGKVVLYSLLVLLVMLVLGVTIIGILAIPFVCFMLSIAYINLYAQYGKYIDVNKYLE